MKYSDLRDFLAQLETLGELKHVSVPVSPRLEMTEICDRTLRSAGPALLFDKPSMESFLGSVRRAFSTFDAKGQLDSMRRSAMAKSYSWALSAARYGTLYRRLVTA